MTEATLKTISSKMQWQLYYYNGHNNPPALLIYIPDSDIGELAYSNQIHGHLQIPGFPEFTLVLQSDNMREFNDKSNLGLDD